MYYCTNYAAGSRRPSIFSEEELAIDAIKHPQSPSPSEQVNEWYVSQGDHCNGGATPAHVSPRATLAHLMARPHESHAVFESHLSQSQTMTSTSMRKVPWSPDRVFSTEK